jgi:hypothetical protein
MSFLRGAEWKPERIALLAFVLGAGVIIAVFALTPSVEEGRAERLALFLETVPPEAAAAFEAGDYTACAGIIETTARTDLVFFEDFEALKDGELINIFTPSEVVDYYARYFQPPYEDLTER